MAWRHMFKKYLSALLALFTVSTLNSCLTAQDCCYSYPTNNCGFSYVADECCTPPNKFYVGVFGGINYSSNIRLRQTGVAFFTEAEGGPLSVDARGHARKRSDGFGGIKLGYELTPRPLSSCSNFTLTPAAEIEAYWYKHKIRGHLINPTARLPEHDFSNCLHLTSGVYLANLVLNVSSCDWCGITPYVGGGIGAVNLCARNASSIQVEPVEAGVNHFNGNRSDHDWSFAAQGKAGVRYNIWENVSVFAEYRFLFVDSSRYNFGPTDYPTHVPTTTWDLDIRNFWYNAFAVGVQFSL